jgi:hypothetical protein
MFRSLNRNLSAALASFAMVAAPCFSQPFNDTLKVSTEDIKTIQKQLDKITESRGNVLHFAVSLGIRYIYDKAEYFGEPSISPIDSTLQIDSRDRGAVILSGVVMATPFTASRKGWLAGLGFVANVNLAEISSEDISTINSKSIEGGLGVSYRLQSNFALALTYDLVFTRRLRDYVLQREGEKILNNGKVLTELNRENDNIFINDNLNSLSLKFIYRFGK